MAQSFRQAYDYWQDQPGLYTTPRNGGETRGENDENRRLNTTRRSTAPSVAIRADGSFRARERRLRNRAAAHRAPPSAATREGELTYATATDGVGAKSRYRLAATERSYGALGRAQRFGNGYAKYGFSSLQDTHATPAELGDFARLFRSRQ